MRGVLASAAVGALIAVPGLSASAGEPGDGALAGDEVAWRGRADAHPGGDRAGPASPRVIFLWYADGGPTPTDGICTGKKTTVPPAYECSFGASPVECAMKVQALLDRWYADFNVVFTLTKPTSIADYTVLINSSGAAWCGKPSTLGGIAPFTGDDILGETAYVFQGGESARKCAVIAAQEQGHLVGLRHTSSPKDVMYPSVCPACDGFEDKENPLAGLSGTQNSYLMMRTRLGSWDPALGPKPDPKGGTCADGSPPVVAITEPADGAAVPADFKVRATASDDCAVKNLHVEVAPAGFEGDAAGASGTWPLAGISGTQTITVTATDFADRTASTVVTVGAPAPDAVVADASGADEREADAGGGQDAGTDGAAEDPGNSGGCSGCGVAGRRECGRATCALALLALALRRRERTRLHGR